MAPPNSVRTRGATLCFAFYSSDFEDDLHEMCDIFVKSDAQALLANKKLVLVGDSNIRGLYKDLIWLMTHNEIITHVALRTKLEKSYLSDELVEGDKLHNGRDYREQRHYRKEPYHIDYFFITHCYDDYIERSVIQHLKEIKPDVVLMTSCLWDITRWGPNGAEDYKKNLPTLMTRLKEVLPETCLFIWATTMPISVEIKGGFLIPQVEFLRHQLRFDIMEANLFAWETVKKFDFDVLDMHYYFQMNIARREKDGIHWVNIAMRHFTNFVLTHVALAWGRTLPGRAKDKHLNEVIKTPLYPQFSGKADDELELSPKPKKKVLKPHRRKKESRRHHRK